MSFLYEAGDAAIDIWQRQRELLVIAPQLPPNQERKRVIAPVSEAQ